ncbi:ATP-binding cassette domain-containing protein [Herbaspirillum robiniae]|uniref:ATP-binding cassette domain-containing protein n=1 Tax=Herbaspirillum robiniae TaxID=2014887 RepID=UPI003D7892D3
MSQTDAIVTAQGLRKTFKAADGQEHVALHDITLEIWPGQLTALVGPDGAGKTTFMRLVNGLLKPDQGRLQVLNQDVTIRTQAVQDRISYMPQRFGLYDDLSVQENLDLYADLHGVSQAQRKQRFARLLEMTDMASFVERPAGKLSGGMKQKLGLACTLVRSPELLLLDEPSVGVDPLSRRDLWRIVQQLVDHEHLSVIVNTAYMDEAERCAQIFVLHEGHVLAQGAPDTLRQQTQGLTFRAVPPDGSPARDLQARLIDAADIIVDAVPKGGEVHFIKRQEANTSDIAHLLHDTQAMPRRGELEDAFMLMLHRHHDKEKEPRGDLKNEVEVQRNSTLQHDKPAVIVRDLVRKFGDFTAVASTSFEIRRGEIFGLLGPNGAGKTTTFRMLCGLLPATSGQLEVAGLNLRYARAQARSRIGYVSQKFALYGNLSVRENLEFFGGAYGLRGSVLRQRVQSLLEQFGLDPEARSGELPGGFKQRLAMAAGLLHEPDLLFLDEPTSGIDPLARRMFWRTITSLAQSGVTIIITTHFMEEAEYCDRIAIQDAGRMLALGTPQEVRLQSGGEQGVDMNSAFIAIVEQGRAAVQAVAKKGRV